MEHSLLLEQLASETLPDAAVLDADDSPKSDGWGYDEAFSRHDGLLTHEEQQRLRKSHVAIVGMGGVGGVHLATLARLGIGKFTIADPDSFELANMNRQYGARVDTLGRSKADVMAEEVRRINPTVQLRVIHEPIRRETVADFLSNADLFVDGIDFFSIDLRRRLFRQAAANGIYSITAGPVGFGTAWLTFDPNGMGFDEYFDLKESQTELEQLIAFAVGLAPAMLHVPYIDLEKVSLTAKIGPSAGLACQLCAGVTAAEALKILLGRGKLRPVPHCSQFDAYRNCFRRRRLWGANRNPLQLLKRWWLLRKFGSQRLGE